MAAIAAGAGEQVNVDVSAPSNGEVDVENVREIPDTLCMSCGASGTTRMLPMNIPGFREIVVFHFRCEECNFVSNETMSTAALQENGVKFTLTLTKQEDLNRQLIKGQYAKVSIPSLSFEIPSKTQNGTVTTIEGLLSHSLRDLQATCSAYEEEMGAASEKGDTALEKQYEATLEKLRDFLSTLTQHLAGICFPFDVVLDDISGNSHLENPFAPEADPNMVIKHYIRSPEQNAELGIRDVSLSAAAAAAAGSASAAGTAGGDDEGAKSSAINIREQSSNRAGWITFDKKEHMLENITPQEVFQIPTPCAMCENMGSTRMCQTSIPHFKDVVIMSFTCEECGFKSNEVKAGGGVPEKGRKFTLKVSGTKPEDMHRDLLKSNTAKVEIPELDFEMVAGSMGGLYTTVEGLLKQMQDQLASANPFSRGDSADSENRKKFEMFLEQMAKCRTGLVPFTLIITDPMDHSFIYSPGDDGFEDADLTREYYERTFEENEDLGLNDMDV